MSTVVKRVFRSSPYREALQTWNLIVDVLAAKASSDTRRELEAVASITASCIADMAPKTSPIVVTCDGPRTRVYCLYDDDAIDGSDAQEDSLSFDPLKGNWAVSIPCLAEDLEWVQSALSGLSSRVTARVCGSEVAERAASASGQQSLVIDKEGFLGR